MIESDVFESLKNQADKNKISLSEICRQKLRQNHQLDRIEILIGKVDEKLSIF